MDFSAVNLGEAPTCYGSLDVEVILSALTKSSKRFGKVLSDSGINPDAASLSQDDLARLKQEAPFWSPHSIMKMSVPEAALLHRIANDPCAQIPHGLREAIHEVFPCEEPYMRNDSGYVGLSPEGFNLIARHFPGMEHLLVPEITVAPENIPSAAP
ncbi:hypothetical protein AA14337_2957 [Acetobacter malorum DSM 14337]|uniref:Uncharacterized protein n=1 Tax=Acetobacter malorum DSM 14337 TaxID=1307910 RepID=A0ABQ0PYU1_9PROT|nr:hypothetical protein [Acetobacter malorum]KXV06740.1 hypothetical protein AD930_06470 [Acetobacter malorum]GBQ84956.1 hypothetical protein AA14337_2957 [Acetobacter malorum DSM 14337]